MKFENMEIKPEIVAKLNRAGFTDATDVQEEVIPVLLEGKDIIVRAKTGTGKTLAFLVPILQKIDRKERGVKAIILVPTRELALQITSMLEKIANGIKAVTIYGGVSINPQIDAISKGADIAIGTPGRVIDLMERGALWLGNISFAVLDECDTMLDMGFIDDVEYILEKLPEGRQTMLFSATVPKELAMTAKKYMYDPKYILVGNEEELTVNQISHMYSIADGIERYQMLLGYVKLYKPKKAIVFARTKNEADTLYEFLRSQKFNAVLMHGGLTQAKREYSLKQFRGESQFLIATNVAARGLDIADITDIINFGAPEDTYMYVHRVGRSARMGKAGRAFTIASRRDIDIIKGIEFQANIEIKKVYIDTKEYGGIQMPEMRGKGFGYAQNRRGRQGSAGVKRFGNRYR